MKSRSVETLTGIFVAGALLIVIAVILFYASRSTLEIKDTYVLYFKGDFTGLHVGSPVKYRGIDVGQVTDFKLIANPKTLDISIPVYIKFIRNRDAHVENPRIIEKMINKGLRAILSSGNLLTGEQYVSLVMRPKTPVLYRSKRFEPGIIEIPTIEHDPRKVDLDQVIQKAEALIVNLNTIVSSDAAQQLVPNANKSLRSADKFLNSANDLTVNVNKRIDPITMSLVEILHQSEHMAYSLRVLTEYLSRHPESLIIGKSKGN